MKSAADRAIAAIGLILATPDQKRGGRTVRDLMQTSGLGKDSVLKILHRYDAEGRLVMKYLRVFQLGGVRAQWKPHYWMRPASPSPKVSRETDSAAGQPEVRRTPRRNPRAAQREEPRLRRHR